MRTLAGAEGDEASVEQLSAETRDELVQFLGRCDEFLIGLARVHGYRDGGLFEQQ